MEEKQQGDSGGIGGMIQDFISNRSKGEVEQTFTKVGDSMDQGERSGFIEKIMDQLSAKGFDINSIIGQLGLSSSSPDDMKGNDVGKIAGFVKEKAPSILPMVVQQMPQLQKYLGAEAGGGMMGKLKGMLGG